MAAALVLGEAIHCNRTSRLLRLIFLVESVTIVSQRSSHFALSLESALITLHTSTLHNLSFPAANCSLSRSLSLFLCCQ